MELYIQILSKKVKLDLTNLSKKQQKDRGVKGLFRIMLL